MDRRLSFPWVRVLALVMFALIARVPAATALPMCSSACTASTCGQTLQCTVNTAQGPQTTTTTCGACAATPTRTAAPPTATATRTAAPPTATATRAPTSTSTVPPQPTATTPPASCPAGVVIPSLTASASSVLTGGSVTLTWGAQTGFGCSALSYPNNAQWSGALTGSTGSKTITGLTAGTTFRVDCGGQTSGGGCQSVAVAVATPTPTVTATSAPQNRAPSVVSVSPSSGSALAGTAQTFTVVSSDPDGYANVSWSKLLFNTILDGANACNVQFYQGSNTAYLRSDGSAWLGPVTLGVPGTLSNSQCTLNAGASAIVGSGTNVTASLSLTFSAAYVGTKNIYMQTQDAPGVNSGWQTSGSWTVLAPAPTATSTPQATATSTPQPTATTPPASCPAGPVIPALTASSVSVGHGGSTTLTWTAQSGFGCTAMSSPYNAQWSGALSGSTGSTTISGLTAGTTFRVDCGGQTSGGGCQSVVVNVAAPTATATSSPQPTPTSTPSATPTATATATTPGTCPNGVLAPNLVANPTSISAGGTVTLMWSAQHGMLCTATNDKNNPKWAGTLTPSSAVENTTYTDITNLTETTRFTISCGAQGGGCENSVTVQAVPTAGPTPPPTTEGEYAIKVGQDFPPVMQTANIHGVTLTVKNTGTVPWVADVHKLDVIAGDLLPIGVHYDMPPGVAGVPVGGEVTFSFTIAPPPSLAFKTGWVMFRMWHKGVGGFGDAITINQDVKGTTGVPVFIVDPIAGPPGTTVHVYRTAGAALFPTTFVDELRVHFGEPGGHDYSRVPVNVEIENHSEAVFTMPQECGVHYIHAHLHYPTTVPVGTIPLDVTTTPVPFLVTGNCDGSRRASFDYLSYNIQFKPDGACTGESACDPDKFWVGLLPGHPATDWDKVGYYKCVLDCAKNERWPLIAENDDLRGHDAIVFEEAFSDSHEQSLIDALHDQYPYQSEKLGDDTGLDQDGGVRIISKWPIAATAQTIYTDCAGFADCHADKGVLYVRLDKAGARYHLFGTHTEAGDKSDNMAARLSQLNQMKYFVANQLNQAQAPASEAVLIAGDFNIDRNNIYSGPEFSSSPITGSDCSQASVCESRCGIVSCTTWDGAQGPLTVQVQCGACPAMSGQQEFERMLTVLPIQQPDRVAAAGDSQPRANRQGKWLDYVFYNTDYLHPLNATNTVLRVRDERSLYKFDDLSDHFAVEGIYHFPPQ